MARLIRAITVLILSHGSTQAAAVHANPVSQVTGSTIQGTNLCEVYAPCTRNSISRCYDGCQRNMCIIHVGSTTTIWENNPELCADCVEEQRSTNKGKGKSTGIFQNFFRRDHSPDPPDCQLCHRQESFTRCRCTKWLCFRCSLPNNHVCTEPSSESYSENRSEPASS